MVEERQRRKDGNQEGGRGGLKEKKRGRGEKRRGEKRRVEERTEGHTWKENKTYCQQFNLDFWSLELGKYKSILFKPLSLW